MSDLKDSYFKSLGINGELFSKADIDLINIYYEKSKTLDNYIKPISKGELDLINDYCTSFLPKDTCLLWTNENSNYAGVYTNGLFKGMVFIVDHEETMYTPVWRSIRSFLNKVNIGEVEDLDNPYFYREKWMDYPSFNRTDEENSDDFKIVEKLFDELKVAEEGPYTNIAFCISNMIPKEKLELLKPLLLEDDMYVQEAVCNIYGFYNYIDAKPWIMKVYETGKCNAKSAANNALKRIK